MLNQMKRLLFNIILLFSASSSFGQLFPELPELKGEVASIIETRSRGHEKPGSWKYYYVYDEHNRKISQLNKFKGQRRGHYSYQYDTTNNRYFTRELFENNKGEGKDDYHEAEYILNSNRKITQCNIWFCNSNDYHRELAVVEKDVKYDSLGRMTSYNRNVFMDLHEEYMNQVYEFHYDSLSRLVRILKKDVGTTSEPYRDEKDSLIWRFKNVPIAEPVLSSSWTYEYDDQGMLISSSFQFHGPTQEIKGLRQEGLNLSYEYDSTGNWINCFKHLDNGETILYMKREIEYE